MSLALNELALNEIHRLSLQARIPFSEEIGKGCAGEELIPSQAKFLPECTDHLQLVAALSRIRMLCCAIEAGDHVGQADLSSWPAARD